MVLACCDGQDGLRAHLDSEGVPVIGEEGGREHMCGEDARDDEGLP